jgi:formate dehydrogenase major subunit
MELSRRDFLKASGAGIGGVLLFGALNDGVALASPIKHIPLKRKGKETSTICPYDASGCGFIVIADANGKVINIEGDPDHPINRGAACAKGASLRQLSADNPWRLSKVLYRAPGGTDWQEKDWNWALDTIAQRIKATRDANFTEKDKDGNIVNRTDAIANLGGSALDNEECYLLAKLTRSLGVVYLEHHARI